MRTLPAIVMTGLAALSSPAPGMAAESTRPVTPSVSSVTLNIEAQSLEGALNAFATQTGLQVVYYSKVEEGLRSPALNGKFSPQEALQQLLAKTSLDYKFLNPRTVAIKSTKENTTGLTAADQMRLARTEEGADPQNSASQPSEKADVIVKDTRDKPKPFADGNADIPRTIDDAQPYYIFDSQEIRRSGATNLETFLKQRLTMNTVAMTNGQMSTTQNQSYMGNTSTINLRGLDADKTLILVDGRKRPGVVKGENTYQPDLNGIPVEAVERIEILPSSASGIYGGSAIGGVVNVILKKDYQGGDMKLSYDTPAGTTGGSQRKVSASYGLALEGGRTRVTANATWSDGTPLLIADRVGIFRKNLDTLLHNVPTYFEDDGSKPWLGSVPNITSLPVYTPVPPGTPGAFGPFPPGTSFGGPPTTEENSYLAAIRPVLTLRDGTSLGSNITHLNPVTPSSATLEELGADALANAGRYVIDFPRSVQNPSGLLRPFGETPEVRSIMASFSRQMTPRLELFADFSINENRSTGIDATDNSLRVPAGAPTNPFNEGIAIAAPDASYFETRVRSRSTAVTLGLRAQLPAEWSAMADYTRSRHRMNTTNNWFDTQALTDEVASGAVDPFVDSLQFPLDYGRYRTPNVYQGSNRLDVAALRGSGPLPSLPWGAPTLTVGLEHSVANTPQSTQTSSLPITVMNSEIWTFYERESLTDSGYLEMLVPLVKTAWLPGVHSLSAQLSGRKDRYTVDAGTTSSLTYYMQDPPQTFYMGGPTQNDAPYFSTASYSSKNYTVGIKYQPVSEVTLRASRATAFLPPTPLQLIRSPQPDPYPTTVNDPVTHQDGVPISTLSGGNPDLVPQSSRSFNAGIIWEPSWKLLAGLRFNAEYYKIEQFDAIGSLSEQEIVNQEASFPDRVTRDATGTITLVDKSAVNLFHRNTEGWDLSIGYARDTGIGRFDLQLSGSIIEHLQNQYLQGDPAYESVGFPSEGGAPRSKASFVLSWERGGWTTAWTTRHISAYKQEGAAGGPSSMQYYNGEEYSEGRIRQQGSDTIPRQMYHDLYLGYSFDRTYPSRWLQGTSVDIGVRNVFNRVPPFDAAYIGNFLLSPFEDIRLRSFWLNASRAF